MNNFLTEGPAKLGFFSPEVLCARGQIINLGWLKPFISVTEIVQGPAKIQG